ncbi:SWIM zinc finger family protein [Deinococcus arenicola]|uniref:SWIM zinc finger family protein n=1 Tax=Deinococcus arenicola TaxID=2994950 RepID=A0ABU4DVE4_9DEIO|nr:SWIM zinc finger family protein [Deinococcus sp. ZS9-10]MDV6376418.1 SWIM zinc finger family protein [Deinococcus sp. ZS9-10]
MSDALTPETILALAPDAGSAANARKLATPGKWPTLNDTGSVLWGECQGSGKNPYLTAVDLSGPVAKCSCPSRKFPCKHGLALLLLHASHGPDFGSQPAPESVQTWLAGRQNRAEKAEQVSEVAVRKEADPGAQAKRRAARKKKVTAGLEGLHLFLKDLMRDGLASASSRPYSDWDTQAARLMDAQASGAARRVAHIPELLGSPAALLAHLGELALLAEGWVNRAGLSEEELHDLRAALGFPLDAAGLLETGGIRGRWNVLGQALIQEEALTVRRTWLQNASQMALLLDFAPGGRPLPPGFPVGQSVEAELVFAPSAFSQRAVLKGEAGASGQLADAPPPLNLTELLSAHADALALNPWLERAAYRLGPVRVVPGEPWAVVDETGGSLPLTGDVRPLLKLLGESGGGAVSLFGEWDGAAFGVLKFWTDALGGRK